jgi:fluoride exporter
MENMPPDQRPPVSSRFGARGIDARWQRRVLVLIGGAFGSLGRAAVTDWVPAGGGWPAGTLLVNLTGSFLLGVLSASTGRRRRLVIPLLGVGLLGAYTTFGTFAYEVWAMAVGHRWWVAVGYVVASVAGGLVAAVLGMRLGGRR